MKKRYKVTFIDYEQVGSYKHVIAIFFSYTAVDELYVDTAEERYHTKKQTIVTEVTNTLAREWELNSGIKENDLVKVMQEYTVRYFKQRIKESSLPQNYEVLTLSTNNTEHPECIFNPAKLKEPIGRIEMFDEFMTDTVTLVKKSGERFKDIKACIGYPTVEINDVKLPIEEGDMLERDLPSGIKEIFIVDDIKYDSGFMDIPAFYSVKVRKKSSVKAKNVIYNITANAPVYGMQVGGEKNTQNVSVGQDVQGIIDSLREIIIASSLQATEKEDIIEDFNSISKLSSRERTEGVIDRVNSRLGTISSIIGKSTMLYAQVKPMLEEIQQLFLR